MKINEFVNTLIQAKRYDILQEYFDVTKITWWHIELPRKGRKAEDMGGWDEELYSKDIDSALRNDLLSKQKIEEYPERFEVLAFTAGEDMKAQYVGKMTVYNLGDKFNWEWSERNPNISDELLAYYHDEVHPHLLESASINKFNSDKELYSWMTRNIRYKHDGKYDINKIESQKYGDCHDQAGYIYHQLKKMGYKTGRLFFVEYSEWNKPGGKTHTICWYYKDGLFYWMETAWGGMEGIHQCGKLLPDVIKKVESNWKFDRSFDKLYTSKVPYDIKNGISFVDYVNQCTQKEPK